MLLIDLLLSMVRLPLRRLEYIHENPVAAGLVNFAEKFKFSTAKFYLKRINEFDIITHYSGN